MASANLLTAPDAIAQLILSTFDALPAKYKPRPLADGRREWVPLAGIVVARKDIAERHMRDNLRQLVEDSRHATSSIRPCMQCVAVATGMKCLPRDKIPLARGNVLHDWHAEVLAIRGFNRWVLDECKSLVLKGESAWLQWKDTTPSANEQSHETRSQGFDAPSTPPFELRPDIDIHMYVSSAPCGDASMELIMAAQDDSRPWTAPAPSAHPDDMLGRGHFDQLGVVRRKPSRPDAPTTWSKSCSDKLAMKQCTSLLSGIVAKIVDHRHAYLSTLILPEKESIHTATQRAFSSAGRMARLEQEDTQRSWMAKGYAFRPFKIDTTSCRFAFSKTLGAVSSNVAALWTPHQREALVNGVLMGRKQFDPRGASCVSRTSLWQTVVKIAIAAGMCHIQLRGQTYRQFKLHGASDRIAVKNEAQELALHNWRRNDGDDDWTINEDVSVK